MSCHSSKTNPTKTSGKTFYVAPKDKASFNTVSLAMPWRAFPSGSTLEENNKLKGGFRGDEECTATHNLQTLQMVEKGEQEENAADQEEEVNFGQQELVIVIVDQEEVGKENIMGEKSKRKQRSSRNEYEEEEDIIEKHISNLDVPLKSVISLSHFN